ncbi:restriction endonuclease subunit S [Thermomonas hydrothermalis]|uniref:Type I restriction enzyme, S subunit n=1 Tax=Thermomonas hydrothermalis TaxID=213588 RepID=A0A1M4S584_9GAMM|nr:restriction endonuclease subunit S [Thermomonas hydrothermalis]SHE27177.1 type I restriction enzyme, S subunit [Thermomonas hydrothermalis]
MAGEWIVKAIGDIATVVGGSTPSTRDPANFDGDIPWLTPKDLAGPHPRYITRGERNLSRMGLESCSAQILPANSVLLSSRAPIGYLAIAKNPLATNQGFRSLVVKPGYDHEFIYYWLFANVAELERHATGSTFKELSGSALKQIRLRLPSALHEQRAIAHILGTLDDKIELNRRMSETLEAMARALFKAWFVDFEPVRAKMEGRWRRGESLLGLPAHLYDLFPDRLVDSELGEVPEGWEMRSLDSIANYLNGLALQKYPPESETEFLPVIKIAQLRAGHTNGADKASTQIKPEYVVVDGDVLFSWSGSLEVAVWNGGRGALNQHLFKVTSDEVPKWFYFFATRQHLPVFRAIAAGKATTMGHIQRKHLTEARIAVAPQKSMQEFDVIIAPLFDQFVSSAQQSRTLATLRDTLLPKLISGELRVKDAERFLEAAT